MDSIFVEKTNLLVL